MPVTELNVANEIYIKVENGNPSLYYYHVNIGADLNTIGWASAGFTEEGMIIYKNTIRMAKEDLAENISVGQHFSGKLISLKENERVPLELINKDSFKIDCNKYLKVNKYKEKGIPYYEDSGSKGSGKVLIGYPATIFAVGDSGICSALLNDEGTPQVKKGWIQFRRIE